MIQLLIRLGHWLEARFPKKLIVTVEAYNTICSRQQGHDAELSEIRSRLNDIESSLSKTLERLSVVEASAVHKGAVADLVSAVKAYKDELSAMKVGLGLSRIGDSEIQAMLNGVPIPNSEDK